MRAAEEERQREAEQQERERKKAERQEADRKERERVAQAQAVAKAAEERELARLNELASTKEYALPITTALICQLQQDTQEANEELRREKGIENRGGVSNLSTRRELAERIEWNSEQIADHRKWLRSTHGVAPATCDSVRAVMDCEAKLVCPMINRMTHQCDVPKDCSDYARRVVEVWLGSPTTFARNVSVAVY